MSEAAQSSPQLNRTINRGVLWTGAGQAIIAVADLISLWLVLAKWVSATEYGTAMMAYAWFTLLDTAADMGVASAVIARGDADRRRLSTVFWFNMMVSGGMFAALCVVGPLYGHYLGYPVVGGMLIAYGGKLIIQNAYSIPLALMRKNLQFPEVARARVIAHLGESLIRPILAANGLALWCFTLAALSRATIFAIVIAARHRFVPMLVFRPQEIRDYIAFGWRNASAGLLYHFYTNIDYVVVTKIFGPVGNGIYSLAYQIILEPVRMITNVVSEVAFPAFAKLHANSNRLATQFIHFTRLNLLGVLPFLLVLFLLAPEMTRLFSHGKWTTAQLQTAADVLRVLCIVGVLRPLGFLGPPLLDGIGQPGKTLRYMLSCAVLMPVLYWTAGRVFGPTLGVKAVAWGWALGYPLPFTVLLVMVARAIALPLPTYTRRVAEILACALMGLAAGWLALAAMPTAGVWARVAVGIGASLGAMLLAVRVGLGMSVRAIRKSMASGGA